LMGTNRIQWVVLFGLSFGVVALSVYAYILNPLLFQRFLGRINPVLAIIVIVLVGSALMFLFDLGRYILVAGLAGLVAAVMIFVDIRVVFPETLNVLLPQSLLYYPVIDYAVQVLFHLLPLSLILVLITSISKSTQFTGLVWPCILLTALLEPLLQTSFFAGEYTIWTVAFVGLHVFVFNVIELALFKRYDFVSMYWFRLVYYIAWHIVWGNLRLRLLF